MPSAFGHAFAAFAIGKALPEKIANKKVIWLGMLCAILPDADVLAFKLHIPYNSFFGHRGFFHSFAFAFIFSALLTLLFFRKEGNRWLYWLYFFLCMASHSLLDAFTSSGFGVAFFSPFNNNRYFFPWQPIKVSPIGLKNFISV